MQFTDFMLLLYIIFVFIILFQYFAYLQSLVNSKYMLICYFYMRIFVHAHPIIKSRIMSWQAYVTVGYLQLRRCWSIHKRPTIVDVNRIRL